MRERHFLVSISDSVGSAQLEREMAIRCSSNFLLERERKLCASVEVCIAGFTFAEIIQINSSTRLLPSRFVVHEPTSRYCIAIFGSPKNLLDPFSLCAGGKMTRDQKIDFLGESNYVWAVSWTANYST